jgi:hypothetical protein
MSDISLEYIGAAYLCYLCLCYYSEEAFICKTFWILIQYFYFLTFYWEFFLWIEKIIYYSRNSENRTLSRLDQKSVFFPEDSGNQRFYTFIYFYDVFEQWLCSIILYLHFNIFVLSHILIYLSNKFLKVILLCKSMNIIQNIRN